MHQFSGGGGFHLFYYAPKNLGSVPSLGKGIDFKSNGYVLIEPSNHHTGGTYDWEASSNPLDGCLPSMLPNWVLSLAHTKEVVEEKAFVSRLLTTEQQADLRKALSFIDADDYNEWVNAGLALKSAGAAGFELWNEYSSRSDKYDANSVARKWNGFKPSQIGYESIFFKAQQNGWVNIPTAPEFVLLLENVKLYEKESQVINGLPKLTGVLGIIENYYNDTAPMAQPLFAKQTAISILSVLLGRRFKTVFGDHTSLYLACVAPTACGKEHIKKTSNKILSEIGKSNLIAGDGYTSAGAIISVLKNQPCHLSTIDEFGLYLQASTNPNNHIGRSANTMLMECIGRLNGEVRSKNYSTMGASKDTKSSETILNPAISIIAMTTPSTYYKSLSVDMIADGFLGRFITVQSDLPRIAPKRMRELVIPASIKEWSDAVDLRIDDQLNAFSNPEIIGQQAILDIDSKALDALDAFGQEMVDLMNSLEKEGLEGLAGRAAEFAGRLALIFQLSICADSQTVTLEQALNAIEYIRQCTLSNVDRIKENLNGSIYQQMKQEVLSAIRLAGATGITERDMNRKAPFSKYKEKELAEVLLSLVKGESIALVNTREGKAGKPKMAYLALNDSELS